MRVQKFIPRWRVTGAVLVLALFTAAPLLGQQTGTLTGTAISQVPDLSDVQIAVTGTGLGQLTNQDGRFLIVNVPVGEHTITAQLIGYGATNQTVTITSGEPVVIDFTLRVRAVQLDGMVVTGTSSPPNAARWVTASTSSPRSRSRPFP